MFQPNRAESLENFIKELVAIPSVTGSSQECLPGTFLHRKALEEPYFQDNPEYLTLTPPDEQGRRSFFALVKAARQTSKTLLLISHFDVVDTDVYGDLENLAYQPEQLEEALENRELPQDVKEDFQSRKWIFGRGVMDMKCGVALELDMILEFARNPGLYDINLAMLSVYDEEGSNTGMIKSISFLAERAKAWNLDFLGALNTEPSDAGLSGTEFPLIFTGSMGKCLAMFYAVGKETHCGNYFQGMSASFLQGCVSDEFEANPNYCECQENTVTLPPAALSEKVVLEGPYSVTIPYKSVSYYNIFTLQNDPGIVMGHLLHGASQAAKKAAGKMEKAWEYLKKEGYQGERSPSWEVEVLTFEELSRRASIHYPGDFQKAYAEWLHELSPEEDLRERCLKLVEKMIPWRGHEGPLLVVGFLPPFMPHRQNARQSKKEEDFFKKAERTAAYAKETFGRTLHILPFFGGLCDLSYLGWEQDAQGLRILRNNLPGWGNLYSLPIEDMAFLDMPVMNMGPLGRDAHKYTERLEKDYALHELPELLRFFVKEMDKAQA